MDGNGEGSARGGWNKKIKIKIKIKQIAFFSK